MITQDSVSPISTCYIIKGFGIINVTGVHCQFEVLLGNILYGLGLVPTLESSL